MFVVNCRTDTHELLSFPQHETKGQKKREKKAQRKKKQKTQKDDQRDVAANAGQPSSETATAVSDVPNDSALQKGASNTSLDEGFNPVYCVVCSTQVAVRDKDEVYHFFNVLSSYG